MVVAEAGGEAGVGRPHFAAALVAVGAADSIDDAFDRYLANGRPGVRPQGPADRQPTWPGWPGTRAAWPSSPTPTASGSTAPTWPGWWASWPRPASRGIEAVYGRYSPRQRRELGNLARRFDLVATGGSDYHGTIKPDLRVGTGQGDLKVPDRVLGQLESRRPSG